MNATNGLGVILENRYYGESYPFENSTTDNLRYLTAKQTIADNAYFAQHAVFPNVTGGDNLTAETTPWIDPVRRQSGGCADGVFSRRVRGLVVRWHCFVGRLNGPSDCIARINDIVDKMDSLIQSNNIEAIQELKSIFGLGSLRDL
ncbi:uncharacterized protein A1O9_11634 [Exophiala aquamarina CBS 119918]|uniref:Uncharacterized protein n=1 Tax=Exophiala aquamarina CBS 119918 TaxID=1182545 RepID=A0A072NZE2_9EURO|nr:uncharacterized protein A1O9_11634 [Exophiala aquamarina CBS 119918]KEF52393.1 hypothetical protein A1O9_11634 [Exophiala aquamarina CBS 119918]